MPNRDIVVIGASAGGIQALTSLVSGLPADLPAAIFVAVHVPPYAVSHLPEILERAGVLPACHAEDGEQIGFSRILIAPPDCHLLLRRGWVELTRGPRENHARPAIDPLFRSAARAYGHRVIGVILSGALYDGSLGLMAIKSRGGIAIVQDPNEASVDSMPRSALRHVVADYVARADEMSALLTTLTMEPTHVEGIAAMIDEEERLATVVASDFAAQAEDERAEEISLYTCPDCGGALWQGGDGPNLWFRCHVGHAYAPEVLLSQKSEELEAALWSSLRLLKEKATLTRQVATRSRESGNLLVADRIEERAALDAQHVAAIEELIRTLPAPIDEGHGVIG